MIRFVRWTSALLVFANCARPAEKQPAGAVSSYSVAERLATPRIFGPGAISTVDPEFSLSLSPDGNTAYFNRASADRKQIYALESHFVNGAWQPAAPVPFSDTLYRYLDVFVAPGVPRLYFTSNRPLTAGKAKPDLDFWYLTVPSTPDAKWDAPVRIGEPVSTASQDVFTSLTSNGTIYFASDREGSSDIYRAELENGVYRKAERLSNIVNSAGSESNPLIAPDESFLIFAAERPDALGAGDLYVSRRVHGAWTTPQNLGAPVNSPYLDFAPGLSPDGKYLFFTSERPGVFADSMEGRRPGDIYEVELATIPAMK